MAMRKEISITLSHDEALVLFEFCSRFSDTDELTFRHNAEFLAFSILSAQLDKSLSDMFNPNYPELRRAARERLAFGYQGSAPGVTTLDA
jgi:hypothetical protein